MSTIYNRLSEERKKLQKEGNCPNWYTTGGYQMFKEKYLYQASNPREQYERIAKTLACHTPDPAKWKEKFFDLLWKGWLSPSTPVLANTGTTRGLPVSCAGTYISDNLDSIYAAKHEVAMLTKWGFGTASDLDSIRGRGEPISVGGKAEGLLPIIQGFQSDMEYVAQGSARRGSWAGYVGIDHNDFDEICTYLEQNPDGNNIGWNISDDFVQRLKDRDAEALRRYGKALKTKMVTGKGYFFFRDKANRKRPQWYKDHGLDIKSSQLCVAPETKILTDKGEIEISKLKDQTVNVWNGQEWSEVIVRKTGEDQKLIKVKTLQGELWCTEYHKFYEADGTQVEAKNLVEATGLIHWETPDGEYIADNVESVEHLGRYDDTYCFTEPKRNMGVFNGILTGNCNEIVLHSSEEYTYTCVLASMNLAHYNDWKNTDAVFVATVFLDCVVQEFIERAKNIKGLEKAVEFTRKGRALGLGIMGWHSLLQQEMIPVESIEAVLLNDEIFSKLDNDSKEASKWIAEQWGEPEWMKGYGYANTHRLAVAPTKSTALLMGGFSEGGGYDTAFVFTQRTPAGEVDRINPVLLKLMKDKGVYNKKNVEEVRYAMGSVQNVDWLTPEEKLVFKTAFEINQSVVLSLASQRGKYLDQWQSLNLYFGYDADESEINKVHREAFLDDDVLGLYYIYSKAGVQASKDECIACQ